MNTYSLQKIGYSAGVYGCSAEWYLLTIRKDNHGIVDCIFNGIYTNGQYIAPLLRHNGYVFTESGGLPIVKYSSREMRKRAYSEKTVMEEPLTRQLLEDLKLKVDLTRDLTASDEEMLRYINSWGDNKY